MNGFWGRLKKEELQGYENIEELSASLAAQACGASGSGGDRGPFSGHLRWFCPGFPIKILEATERVVKKDHPDSKFKLVRDGFVCKVPISPGQVHAINDALSTESVVQDHSVYNRTRAESVMGLTLSSKLDQDHWIFDSVGRMGL